MTASMGHVTTLTPGSANPTRWFVRESGADNAGHEGASMAAAANATVAAPSIAEIAPGWMVAVWVSHVPAAYAPVAHLDFAIEAELVTDADGDRAVEGEGNAIEQQQQRKSTHPPPPPPRQTQRAQTQQQQMRLVHGAQSEVHLAFYHAGRWSPASAAVRWLEVGEGTTVGAAVVCPLPPERRSRGAGLTVGRCTS
jgi:hypothetical protein